MKIGTFVNPQKLNTQETYTLTVHKRKLGNNAYEYDETPRFTFKGRPATRLEKKTYRVVRGVNTLQNGVTIYASNLPNDLEVEDRVTYMGRVMIVKNIGYFVDDVNIVNAGIFDNEYLLSRFPKGITLT